MTSSQEMILGYRRADGRVGVRNSVAILSVMDNTNPTAYRIGTTVLGTTVLATPFGRGQIGLDHEITVRTLIGAASNPNVASVLVLSLSLGSATPIADRLRELGIEVEVLGLQECGSALALTLAGSQIAARMVLKASKLRREPAPLSCLTVGVECGGSDTTSGLASNPAVGNFADKLVDAGGRIILSEPAEFMGAEHILEGRAVHQADASRIREIVRWFEEEAARNGVDMRGTNPTPDNIEGGLSTLEEKSLGAIAKGGTRPILQVVEYAEAPTANGLCIMNTPSAACESMTGLLAGGAQLIIFSTGRGNAIGAPVAPTIKVSGNPHTVASMADNIDVDVSQILSEGMSIESAGARVWEHVVDVSSGTLTTCEVLKEEQLSVSRFGPSV